jgi:hypothetical protein
MPSEEPWYIGRDRFFMVAMLNQLGGKFGPRHSKSLERLIHERWTKSRAGRPPAGYHTEWAARFRELMTEQMDGYEFSRVDGEQPPSKLGVALLVAIEDFAVYPERWKYDPESRPRNAERTVWKAVKPLI